MHNLLASLKALADENRLKIVTLLLHHDYCVGALARQLGITKAAVSQQLQILRRANLVRGEKRGYWTHYKVERDGLVHLAETLKELEKRSTSSRYGCQRQPLEYKQLEPSNLEGREAKMCECGCEKPQKLEKEPGKCSPEKIKECHGEGQNHPCESEKE